MPMCGGLGDAKQADEKIQKICDQVSRKKGITGYYIETGPVFNDDDVAVIVSQMKPHAEQKTGKNFSVFTAKSYKTQVVAGTNYFIKVMFMQA